ncbi:hypothetical protein [Leptolyngbya phage Lbo-JY46]
MNSIQLTDEHKSKLIEMCKVLFPEWKAHSLGETYISDDTGEFSESDETFKIHWFEFCMTHLRRELNLHHDDLFLSTNPDVNTFIHPVDYLYQEFKKLNNEGI